jgi:hypothetical protein
MTLTDLFRFVIAIPAKILLNPICFLCYLLLFPETGFTPILSNSSQIRFSRYTLFSIAFFIAITGFNLLVSRFFSAEVKSIDEFSYQLGNWSWASGISWALMLLILNVYAKGMEGNIMGFFGMPIILLSTAFLIFGSWNWISTEFWQGILNVGIPFGRFYAELTFFQKILICTVFNPITVYTFQSNLKSTAQGGVGNLIIAFIASVVTTALMLFFWVCILWIFKSIFVGKSEFVLFFKSYFDLFHQFKILSVFSAAIFLILAISENLSTVNMTGFVSVCGFCSLIFVLGSGVQSAMKILSS